MNVLYQVNPTLHLALDRSSRPEIQKATVGLDSGLHVHAAIDVARALCVSALSRTGA